MKPKARPSKPQASPTRDDLIDAEAHDATTGGRPPTRHRLAVLRFASDLAKALGPHLGLLRHSELSPREILEDALVVGLGNPSLVADLAESLDALDPPLEADTILRGDLARIPLAEVLQLCELRRQTGILRVTSDGRSIVASLQGGTVDLVFAARSGDAFRLGRYLRRLDLVTEEELARALESSAGVAPLGERLVAEGLVAEEALSRALALQSAELLYEAVRWPSGRFTLSEEAPWPEASRAHLGLPLGGLLLEALRRHDEWRVLDELLPKSRVFVVDAAALEKVRAKLGPVERATVELLDGARTVTEVLEATTLGAFDVASALGRLVKAKVVR